VRWKGLRKGWRKAPGGPGGRAKGAGVENFFCLPGFCTITERPGTFPNIGKAFFDFAVGLAGL